jgi:acyl-CoA thioesterase FadM
LSFSTTFQTRHTDAFAATGFVHAGVLLALTELAYAEFERHCGIAKPGHVVAMQRETRALYHAPLPWQDGATIEVVTTAAGEQGFTQEFGVCSAASGRPVATFVHRWAWVDTSTGGRVPISPEDQSRLLGDAPT